VAVRGDRIAAVGSRAAENRKGTLAPGMLADVVVLSSDIFALEPAQLLKTQVACTIVGGRVVYGD
jgi:predicted amidohydrolase YtcJ